MAPEKESSPLLDGGLPDPTVDPGDVLDGLDLPILCLDRRLRIRWFSQAAGSLLGLTEADLGRAASDAAPGFADGDLDESARLVLNTGAENDREVRIADGRWYLRRLRALPATGDAIHGVVVVFIDVGRSKQAERAISDAPELAERIIDSVRRPMLVLDEALRVVRANSSFRSAFPSAPGEPLGQPIHELFAGRWSDAGLRGLLERALVEGEGFEDFETEHHDEAGGRRVLLLSGRRVGTLPIVLLAMEDATDRRRSRRRLEATKATLEAGLRRQDAALRVVHEITRAANAASTPEEAMAVAVRSICEYNSWDAGHAWRVADDDSGQLVSTNVWHMAEPGSFDRLREVTSCLRLDIGEGFAGSVARSPTHVVVDDPESRFDDWRRGVVVDLGVRSAIGIPVASAGETVGVLEFFNRRSIELDPAFAEFVVDVASQIAHVVERQRLERLVATRTDQERQRLAAELHDSLGQQIAAMSMLATSLTRHLVSRDSPRAGTARKLVQGLEDAKHRARALTKGLIPVEIDAGGLLNALSDLVDAARTASPSVDFRFECRSPVELDDTFSSTQLYRIAQEALHNASTHASPSRVVVGLDADTAVRLEVRDDGVGIPDPPPPGAGSGLRIMRHRAGLIGGRLTIDSAPGRGTIVRCIVPRPR